MFKLTGMSAAYGSDSGSVIKPHPAENLTDLIGSRLELAQLASSTLRVDVNQPHCNCTQRLLATETQLKNGGTAKEDKFLYDSKQIHRPTLSQSEKTRNLPAHRGTWHHQVRKA